MVGSQKWLYSINVKNTVHPCLPFEISNMITIVWYNNRTVLLRDTVQQTFPDRRADRRISFIPWYQNYKIQDLFIYTSGFDVA